jgi:hypothetical protein
LIEPMPLAAVETSADELARALEEFFAEYPRATIAEDGHALFDMAAAHFSISTEQGRCLLHLWSEERNLVRTVCGLKARKDSLRVETRRFGQIKPQVLELAAHHDRRAPSTRESSRGRYLRLLDRVAGRAFPDWKLEGLRSAADLEHSFGPAYARGTLLKGTAAWAVIGVNGDEPQSTIDGVLTLGILWLAYCCEHGDGRRLYEGLKVMVPAGMSQTVRARMAWLNESVAKWELYELDVRVEQLQRVDARDCGNLRANLVHAFNPEAALERSRAAVDRVLGLLGPGLRAATEIRARSAAEIAFLLHGLEFARIRSGFSKGSFAREDEISFGAGANETPLNEETEDLFRELTQRLFEHRHADGTVRDPLFRLQPERWLECCLRRDIGEIEPALRGDFVYSQVPAFAAGDRAMLDLLAVTHAGRLAVLELKADDDLHLPFQALDYWERVRQLHRERAFEKHGYFPGIELSEKAPLLYLVAPSLRIHPSTDVVLRHFSAEVPWEVIGLNEDWRKRRKVVLRKRVK